MSEVQQMSSEWETLVGVIEEKLLTTDCTRVESYMLGTQSNSGKK